MCIAFFLPEILWRCFGTKPTSCGSLQQLLVNFIRVIMSLRGPSRCELAEPWRLRHHLHC